MTESSGGVKGESSSQVKDPERFYCPFPGCNRSFAELWRLKVHYRAPPDIRGSGKERGHGTELSHCPKCGKTLKPGKHHVGCSAGRTAPRQATKRTRLSHPDSSILDVALMQDSFQDETSIPDHIMQQLMGSAQQYCKSEAEPLPIHDFMQSAHVPVLALPLADVGQNQLAFANMHSPPVAMPAVDPQMPSHFSDMQAQQQSQTSQQQQQHAPQPQQQTQFGSIGASAPFMSFGQNISHFAPAASNPAPTLNLQLVDQGGLQSVFDYDEMENRVPSPPPLPPDFHEDEKNTGGFLFNFGQFTEKLPSTVQPAPHPYELVGTTPSTSDQSWDTWSGKLCSQTTNDGDLMQILFGLPDEYPVMATSHLHQFENISTPTTASETTDTQKSVEGVNVFDFTDESPRFSSLMHGDDLGQTLDMHMDRTDVPDFACSPTSVSMSLDHGNGSDLKPLLPQQMHCEPLTKSLTINAKKVDHSFHSEMHLSPTSLLKDSTSACLPRVSTFEQELYQLLRPCE